MHRQTVKFYTEEGFPEWGIEPHPGKHKQNGSVLPKEVKGRKFYLFNLYNLVSAISRPPHFVL